MQQSSYEKGSLIQSLEKRGLLDITKAYLRSNIYENLKSNNNTQFGTNNFSSHQTKGFSDNSAIKLSISLITDFLRKLNLSYTLNVFNNESKSLLNTYPYTESEMLSIMNIKVANLNSNPGELFNSFICYLAKEKLTPHQCVSTESQTDYRMTETSASTQIPIDELLRNVDMKYTSKINMDQLLPSKVFEERMSKYKTEMDSRYQIDLDAAIKRFHEIEASQIRIEENKKYMKKIEDIRDTYEKEYKTKFDSLTQRENDFKIRMAQKETDYESLLHHNRQKFQEELEVIRIKEEEMNRRIENEMNKLHLEENKLQFQIKENDYIKDTSLNKIKEQVDKFKFDYDKQFDEEKKDLNKRNNECIKKELIQGTFQEKYDNCVRERNELSETVKKMRNELNLVTSGNDRSSKDNEILREQIRSMTIHEKRNTDIMAKNDIEIHLLKDEINLLKQSLDSQKQYNDIKKNGLYDEMNRKLKESNEVSLSTRGGNSQNDLYKTQIKSLEETCCKYKDMCNTLIHQQKYQTPTKNVSIDLSLTSKSLGPKYNVHANYNDRRKVLAMLENEQMNLNKEINSSFRHLTRKEAPLITFTEGQIKQIKRDNYLKNVLDIEKEKYIQEIYNRNELTAADRKEVLDSNSNVINSYSNALQEQIKRETESAAHKKNKNEINKVGSNSSQDKKINISNEEEKKLKNQGKNGNISNKYQGSSDSKYANQYENDYIRNDKNKLNENDSSSNQSKLQTTTEVKPIDEDALRKTGGFITGINRVNSNKDPFTENEISVENITSDSKDFNYPNEKNSERNLKQIQQTVQGNHQSKPTDKNMTQINTSIKEEIEESHTQSPNISNLIDNKSNKNDSSDYKSSTINKFQNIDYENKKEDHSGIDEYGDDFIEDIDGLDKNKQSLDIEAINKASIGHLSAKGKLPNISLSLNKSSGSGMIDKIIQSHPSNIDENIEEEFSYDNNSNSKKDKSNKMGNDDSSSNNYNDFVASNVNLSSKKDITMGKDMTSGEIKEEIIQDDEDDDGYNPY